MTEIELRLHRLSPNQLKALFLLAQTPKGIISSTENSAKIGKQGKALGGVFSSLSRQNIKGEKLVFPWGKMENGRGLRWKLNEKLISMNTLLKITKELLV
jgi:hypothetical protein